MNVFEGALVAGAVVGVLTLAGFAQTGRAPRGAQYAELGVAVTVHGTVEQTIDRLKKAVADNGMMVMGEIHQGKVLAMTGLKVDSETIFVGNPSVGKQLFSQEPGVGLVVPIRINVYADANGRTVVRYIPPSQQLDAFGNSKVNEVCTMLDGKLHKLVSMLPQ